MNVDRTFVSVILPTFNRADTLPRSIGSVLEQQHKNLELIVVDDGSTDRTRELVANISDPRIRYIWVDRNRGQSAARNVGISIARAELVAFQNSDDLWAREKLTRQLQALLDDPRLAGVYCDLRRHQLDGAQFLIELLISRSALYLTAVRVCIKAMAWESKHASCAKTYCTIPDFLTNTCVVSKTSNYC
jgi:glycosyltransferase involved in cell wall biosynthesis